MWVVTLLGMLIGFPLYKISTIEQKTQDAIIIDSLKIDATKYQNNVNYFEAQKDYNNQ